MNINEHFAINVMGWVEHKGAYYEKLPPEKISSFGEFFDSFGKCFINDWSPTENIDQAIMCLDKFIGWSLHFDGMEYEFNLSQRDYEDCYHKVSGTNLAQTLCDGMAKATGWKE